MNRLMILAVFVVLVLILFYFLFVSSQPHQPTFVQIEEPEIECIDEERQDCIVDDCDGIKLCVGGKWSGCSIDRICIPGTTTPCSENSCIVGYQTCNECGTGYEECIR